MGDRINTSEKSCDRKVMLFMTVSPFALAIWAVEAKTLTVSKLRVIVSVSV